jgi:hypothetical protein
VKQERPVELTYHVEIRGHLPWGTHDELRRRFGEIVTHCDADRTVLSGLTVDQAALRAVLGLLWDVGGELHLLRVITPADYED